MKNTSESLLTLSLKNPEKSPEAPEIVTIQESPDITPPMSTFFYPDLYAAFYSKSQSKPDVPKLVIEEESPRGAIPIPKSRRQSCWGEEEQSLNADTFKPSTPPSSPVKKSAHSLDEHDLMFFPCDDIDAEDEADVEAEMRQQEPQIFRFESQAHTRPFQTSWVNFTPPVITSPIVAPVITAAVEQPSARVFCPNLKIDTGDDAELENIMPSELNDSEDEVEDHELLFSFEERFIEILNAALDSTEPQKPKKKVTTPTPLPTRAPLQELSFFPAHHNKLAPYPFGFQRSKPIDIPTPKKGNEATKTQPRGKLITNF